MSSLKTVTLDVSGWSNEKVCEFLDWLEMFEDHQPGKETCYSLKEAFATGSEDLDTSETLEELKETQQDLLQIRFIELRPGQIRPAEVGSREVRGVEHGVRHQRTR